jgi:transposase
VPSDIDGLTRLVATLGRDVHACIEMMSGAAWVRDRLEACGWRVEVADSRKVRALAPLAAKTDKVDARVLAELARRDLVPALWIPSLEERELRERLARRMHLVRLRTSAKNRVFGVLSQWGVRVSLTELRRCDAPSLLERREVPEVWRQSVVEALDLIDLLDARVSRVEEELQPLARADRRVQLLETIPGLGNLLALTCAVAIGDVSRFPTPQRLVGYSGLVPRVRQSGESSRSGKLAKSGSRLLRWTAVEAAQNAWRPTNPWNRLYLDVKQRHGKSNPAKAAVARKVLIAAWHVLQRQETFKPARSSAGADAAPASSHFQLAA